MEKLGLNDIRKMFREFYVSKEHYPAKSASLIPQNDRSLLLINSGMAPLKPYFAGLETPPAKRMTTCQKCIRTGDIENVGKTARHGTFFEMLGNFSFGDYFKEQSLTWGWEFITEYLKLPEERLWASVYEDDDDAYEIWKKLGVPEERIVRLGKDDNFWEIGLGPCGPCSEIYFDRGEEYGCGKPDCKPGCDCDRYIEFWNHVFTQFSKEEDGTYTDLAHPNIDTGMGLERIACICQGVDSIFDIDTIKYIRDGVTELAKIDYKDGELPTDVSVRIITDHLRSMVFMIGDGIIPSNEGRGYVLRRLIRRAARHGKLLGIKGSFLSGLVDRVVKVSGEAYPEIAEKQEYIKKIISVEEEKFASTIDQGTSIIGEYIEELNELAHQEDPTRLTTAASFLSYDDPISAVTDLIAWNQYFGWYGGAPSEMGEWLDANHKAHPKYKIAISEYGAGASIYHQQDSLKRGDASGWWHPENYQTYYHIENWKALAERPFVWGSFLWNMFDFGAAHRTEGDRPGINDKGLVTFDRKVKKDAFYFYKANWNKVEPFVYIANRRHRERTLSVTDIQIFSNQSEVELFVNGKSQGRKQADDYATFEWKGVALQAGDNRIEVRSTSKKHPAEDHVIWHVK